MVLPRAITGSPHGTLEAPLPPVRGFFISDYRVTPEVTLVAPSDAIV